jgi:hypothetical protein
VENPPVQVFQSADSEFCRKLRAVSIGEEQNRRIFYLTEPPAIFRMGGTRYEKPYSEERRNE